MSDSSLMTCAASLPNGSRDVEEDLDGEVVEEDAGGDEQGVDGGDRGAEALPHRAERFFADEGAIALAELTVELADVRPFELDDVDEDQREVGLELADRFARGEAELLDVVGERVRSKARA